MPMRYGQNSYSLAKLARLSKEETRSYVRADDGKFSSEPGSSGSEAAPAEEEAAEEETAERAPVEEREAALGAAGLSPEAAAAFDELTSGLADGEDIALSPENMQTLIDAGLVTPREGSDWAVDLTDKGKAVADAAATGNAEGAAAAMAGDAPATSEAAPAAEADAEEAKKPKGGGGGGGGGKSEEDAAGEQEAKEQAKAEAKEQAAQGAAESAGVGAEGLATLRSAADGGAVDTETAADLLASGLMEDTPDGPQLTSEGRRALASIERGDARGAVAAQQDAQRKQRTQAARSESQAARQAERDTKDKERAKQQAARQAERQAKETEQQERQADATRRADARAARERELLAPWMKAFVAFTDPAALGKSADAQIVYGIASTAIVDDQPGTWEGERYDGDVVDPDAMREAIASYWGNIREMHDDRPSTAAGVALDVLTADDGRTYLVAKIQDTGAWSKVRERVYKGFSIGGRVLKARLQRLTDGRVVRRILKLLLTEISLVDRPANPEAAILVFKRHGGTMDEETAQTPLEAVAALAGDDLRKMGDPKKVIAQIQQLRNDAEMGGDLEAAERYTQAIGLMLVGAGDADMAEADESADVEMMEDGGDVAEGEAEKGYDRIQASATGDMRKSGRKIAGSRMKVMKDAVMAYLKVLADAGDADADAMIKVATSAAPPMDAKAMIAEIQKATSAPLEMIAKAVLKLNEDMEAIRAQPVGGGPVQRFAGQPVSKRLAGHAPVTQGTVEPDPSHVARLRQLVASETHPTRRQQYEAELQRLTAA